MLVAFLLIGLMSSLFLGLGLSLVKGYKAEKLKLKKVEPLPAIDISDPSLKPEDVEWLKYQRQLADMEPVNEDLAWSCHEKLQEIEKNFGDDSSESRIFRAAISASTGLEETLAGYRMPRVLPKGPSGISSPSDIPERPVFAMPSHFFADEKIKKYRLMDASVSKNGQSILKWRTDHNTYHFTKNYLAPTEQVQEVLKNHLDMSYQEVVEAFFPDRAESTWVSAAIAELNKQGLPVPSWSEKLNDVVGQVAEISRAVANNDGSITVNLTDVPQGEVNRVFQVARTAVEKDKLAIGWTNQGKPVVRDAVYPYESTFQNSTTGEVSKLNEGLLDLSPVTNWDEIVKELERKELQRKYEKNTRPPVVVTGTGITRKVYA